MLVLFIYRIHDGVACRYDVADAAGNPAKRKTRRVSVVCPDTELLCPDTGDGLSCSCNKICGLSAAACASGASPVSSGGTSSSGSGTGTTSSTSTGTTTTAGTTQSSSSTSSSSSSTTTTTTGSGTGSEAEPLTVSLSLQGLDVARVKAGGAPYDRCLGTATDACDAGATATRVSPGDMTAAVVACGDRALNALKIAVRLSLYLQSYYERMRHCKATAHVPSAIRYSFFRAVISTKTSDRVVVVLPCGGAWAISSLR